jgi:peptidylprolyl isomerase
LKLTISLLVILLSTSTLGLIGQGQTKSSRATSRRSKSAKSKKARRAKASNVTTTRSGLIYVVTRRSEGRQPQTGDTVVVHYTGLLNDGAKFDSSLDRGQPFSFKLGRGQVIKGWDEGIARMHVGERATLIIPPDLGYGVKGAGNAIPSNATLIFIVELLRIE